MRRALLTTAMLCAAVTAAAQSHEPAAKTGAKPAPVVSRITAAPKPTPAAAAADHGEAEAHPAAAAKGKAKPLVSGATAPSAGAATPAAGHEAEAHARRSAAATRAPAAHAAAAHAPAGPAAAKAPPAKGPANLATVHGRLTAALAGLHDEPARTTHRPAPAPPRYVVTWPAARWRVAWRDDADRVVISWPE